MSLYEDLYLAAKKSEQDPEADVELQQAALAFLNQLGTNDLAMVVNIAENYVGENAHLMEPGEVEDLRSAIERLREVYK